MGASVPAWVSAVLFMGRWWWWLGVRGLPLCSMLAVAPRGKVVGGSARLREKPTHLELKRKPDMN